MNRISTLTALLLLLVCAACTSNVASDETSLRIVSLSPTATEMLFAVGAGDLVVAVDQYSDFPAEAPTTDLDGFTPNAEAIAAYEPDIVFLESAGELQPALESIGIRVVVQNAAVTLADTYAQISEVGQVTGYQENAETVNQQLRTQIAKLVAAAPDAKGLSYYHELDPTLYSVTSATFVGAVYQMFGLENVADPADANGTSFGYPQLSDEYLVDADPDLIFLADTLCCEQSTDSVAQRPGWEQLSAVQNGNVIELDDSIASRWGPRIIHFVNAISEALRNL
ncbi:MAG: ABC transporter substrate-binding protein [Acidimicrobiaceae bacterium]|nr:ABC transporter substrate-binding protein [Acidimicrobiaceae bacterium]